MDYAANVNTVGNKYHCPMIRPRMTKIIERSDQPLTMSAAIPRQKPTILAVMIV